jgi:hypothetical protein
VDHDVDAFGDIRLAAREVAVDHGHALVEDGEEAVVASEPLTEDIEGGLAREVVHPVDGARRLLRPDEHGDPGIGEVQEEALQDHLAQEPRDAGKEDPLAGEGVHDGFAVPSLPRLRFLYHAADYRLSTAR